MQDHFLSLAVVTRSAPPLNQGIVNAYFSAPLTHEELINGRLFNHKFLAAQIISWCHDKGVLFRPSAIAVAFEGSELHEVFREGACAKEESFQFFSGLVSQHTNIKYSDSAEVGYGFGVPASLLVQYQLWAMQLNLELTCLTSSTRALIESLTNASAFQAVSSSSLLDSEIIKKRAEGLKTLIISKNVITQDQFDTAPEWVKAAHYGLFLLGEKNG